jgi:hypothetical protein
MHGSSPPAHIQGGRATARWWAEQKAAQRERIDRLRSAGLSFQEIGKVMGISRQRARLIFNRKPVE